MPSISKKGQRYPWNLVPRLARCIEHRRRDAARQDLARLLQVIASSEDRATLAIRKLRCAQIISQCLRAAHRGGGASETLLAGHLRVLDDLARARRWTAVESLMMGYIQSLVVQVHAQHQTDMAHAVDQIRRHMQQHIEAPWSQKQYALEHGVSTRHLSRCFAQTVGLTFRQELCRLRMETAQKLLRRTNLKVSAVAHRVGVRSASQFVADFRRQVGVTPALFRLAHPDRAQLA